MPFHSTVLLIPKHFSCFSALRICKKAESIPFPQVQNFGGVVKSRLLSTQGLFTKRLVESLDLFPERKWAGSLSQARLCHFKAAVLKDFEEKLELKEIKKQKKLKDQEVRIKVHSCAVNVSDVLMCFGKLEPKPKLPFVPGYEYSGEVLEVGSAVKGLCIGDKVIGLNKEAYSALAQECITNNEDLWKIPQDVSYETAAALADNYATVLIAARRASLNEGDNVLITAAAGGLGLAAVDIAANLFKAKVLGACDTENKASLLRDKGAYSAINYNKKEITDAVMKMTNNVGVKMVIDAVGGEIFDDCLQSIAPEGSVIVVGFASRKVPEILVSKLLPKSCALIGVSLTHYRNLVNDTYRNTVQEVIDMYLEEFIDPQIAATFDLEQVNDAFKFIEDKKSTGKVIVNIH